MHRRAVRRTVVALLLAAAGGAGLFVWDTERRLLALTTDEHTLSSRLDRLSALVGELTFAEQAYVTLEQPDAPWFTRVSALTSELRADVEAVSGTLRSSDGTARLQEFADALERLVEADRRARENLRVGQDLMAADVIFGEVRQTLAAMAAQVPEIRGAERAAFEVARGASARRSWIALGAVGVLLALGLVALADVPRPALAALPQTAAPPATESNAPAAPAGPAVDLSAAAEICAAISRVSNASALSELLARAAAVIDARGIIVWMGAGEELFPVTAFGYDAEVLSQLGSIHRAAENATAACWRTGHLRTVAAERHRPGAIVTPMFGPDRCIGVLAAEVLHGREQDASTRAVTIMIAAQFATVVSAWPAASGADTASMSGGSPQPRAAARG